MSATIDTHGHDDDHDVHHHKETFVTKVHI